MVQADAEFFHCQFIWMVQTNMPVMLLDPDFNAAASLPNVNLTAFAGYAVHVLSLGSSVID
jgi:hypothetical protein